METTIRTAVKTLSYRTAVALSTFIAALAMGYSAGFGLTFVILTYTLGYVCFFIHEKIWTRVSWGMQELYETRSRSVAKTVSWRIASLIILFFLSTAIGLSNSEAVEWTIVTNIMFVVVHYLHERLWNIITWGKPSAVTTE